MPRRKATVSAAGSAIGAVQSQLHGYLSELGAQRAALDAAISGIERALERVGGGAVVRRGPGRPPGPGRPRGPGRPPGSGTRPAAAVMIGAPRRGRPAREGSLKSFIISALQGSPGGMRVKDIANSVRRAGYKSNSRSFGNQVSAAIAQMKGELNKLGRGTFRLK